MSAAPRLVVFDCDGTLVDSQANIIRAMEHAFGEHRLDPPDRHAVRRVVGLSLVESMQVLLPEAEPDFHIALADTYKRAFHHLRAMNGLVEEPLFLGVRELVHELHEAGYLLGVATGKSDRGLRLCLEAHGIFDRFLTLQTADRHPSKPDPSMLRQALLDAGADPHEAVIVGDTVFDMMMGKNAEVTAVGVDWGYHDAHELTAAGAHSVAADVRLLRSAILDIVG